MCGSLISDTRTLVLEYIEKSSADPLEFCVDRMFTLIPVARNALILVVVVVFVFNSRQHTIKVRTR